MSLAVVKYSSLRSSTSAHLFDAIIRGELRPGERIVEGKLAQQLGVSKTTLREALQELHHQGMVTKHEHRGTYVTSLSAQDIQDAYAVRLQLEPYAAGLAQQRMSPKRLAQLSDLLDKIQSAGERGDFVAVSKIDAQFHELVWHASGNALLERTLKLICFPTWAFELIQLHGAPTYDFANMLQEHQTLLAALKQGGPDHAQETFHKMLELFRDQDIENLKATEKDPSLQAAEAKSRRSGDEIWGSLTGKDVSSS
ncbi:MAG: hypothetical protein DMG58_15155 [Acidobacteria bacterium]|nr:MAG: hypothetical protein DMG58_15155 [Acidobacteriota bacterium]